MDWSDAVILSLRALWDEGLSTAEIGRRLGVTKNAVVGKAHRLVLPARPSPIRRGVVAAAAPRRATGPTLPSMEAVSLALPMEADHGASVRGSRSVAVVLPEPAVARVGVAALVRADVAAEGPAAAQAPRPVAARVGLPVLRPVAAPRRMRVVACCWPIGEPGTRSFRFCDAESMAGKPYCETHAQLAYVKVRDRREDAA